MFKVVTIKLNDEWMIINCLNSTEEWTYIVMIHMHEEGSFSAMNTKAKECKGCGKTIPKSYKMIHRLQELNNEL